MASSQLHCSYTNSSDGPQVVRLTNSDIGLEKIIEPGMSVDFRSERDSILEVHDFQYLTSTLAARIECGCLALT